MSYWDLHFLAGCGLVLLMLTISGIGFYAFQTRSTIQESKAGRFILWLGFFSSLSLLHLWLDTFNPVLFIGG